MDVLRRKSALLVEQIPSLRRYARALTGHADQADELVQDCLERAWSRLHLWRRGTTMRPWLFTIMHNLYVNTVRQGLSRPAMQPLDSLDRDSAVRPLQEDAVEVWRLSQAVDRLPDDQKQIILLVAVEEFSYREAAAITGVPIGTVMSRLSRARDALRKLREEGTTGQQVKREG